MVGCGLLDTRTMGLDVVVEDGVTKFADTESNFASWRDAMELHLDGEISGEKQRSHGSWECLWTSIFRALETNQENAGRYMKYIETRRDDAGLPELKLECN